MLLILRHRSCNSHSTNPLLLGVSRKSFIGTILGGAPPKERVWGTAAACALAAPHADVLRVHDVRELREVAAVADALTRGGVG